MHYIKIENLNGSLNQTIYKYLRIIYNIVHNLHIIHTIHYIIVLV